MSLLSSSGEVFSWMPWLTCWWGSNHLQIEGKGGQTLWTHSSNLNLARAGAAWISPFLFGRAGYQGSVKHFLASPRAIKVFQKISKTKIWQETQRARKGRGKHSPLVYLSFKAKRSGTKVRLKSRGTAWWETVKGKFMQDPQRWVKTFLWSPAFPSHIPTWSPPFVFR